MSNKAKKPKAALPSPAEREATADVQTVEIEFDDAGAVTVPSAPEQLRADVFLMFEEGKAVSALRAVLGASQYQKRISAPGKTMEQIQELFGAVMSQYGFDSVGES